MKRMVKAKKMVNGNDDGWKQWWMETIVKIEMDEITMMDGNNGGWRMVKANDGEWK